MLAGGGRETVLLEGPFSTKLRGRSENSWTGNNSVRGVSKYCRCVLPKSSTSCPSPPPVDPAPVSTPTQVTPK